MPIPKPGPKESQDKFISRCISTLSKVDSERPEKQIAAICYSAWRDKDKKKSSLMVNKMDRTNFKWVSEFDVCAKEDAQKEGSLIIAGTAIDSSVNENQWQVTAEEMSAISKGMEAIQLRIDHGESVRDVIGGVSEGTYDKENGVVLFKAEVDDPDIIKKILKKRVNKVSIGATADTVNCSKCGEATRPYRTCKCVGAHDIIKGVTIRELSIVSSPAYKNAEFAPISFTAAVNEALFKESIVTPELISVTETIVGPVITAKTEEVEQITSDSSETITIGDTHSEVNSQNIKMEEKKIMAIENKEPNVTEVKTETKVEDSIGTAVLKKLEDVLSKFDEISTRMTKLEDAKREETKVKEFPPEDEDEDEDEADKEKKKMKKELEEALNTISAMSKVGAKVDTSEDGIVSTEIKADDWVKEIITAAKKYEII